MHKDPELPYIEPLPWMKHATCTDLFNRDPGMCDSIFFPNRPTSRHEQIAKNICAECPVFTDCFQYMLTMEEPKTAPLFYIAGLSNHQRAVARERHQKAQEIGAQSCAECARPLRKTSKHGLCSQCARLVHVVQKHHRKEDQ